MKKSLEDLVFLGYTEKEINLLNKTWKIRILNSQENLDVLSNVKQYEDMLTRSYAFKIETLGRALKEVNGILIESETEGLEFVKKLSSSVLNALYDEYSSFFDEQNKLIMDKEEIKN